MLVMSSCRFARLLLLGLVSFSFGQTPSVLETESYLKPPPEIERLVMAPRWQNVTLANLSPDRTKYLVSRDDGMPPLAALGKAHLNLGGFQVDTRANRSRSLTIQAATGLMVIDARDGKRTDIEVPKGVEVSRGTWSPDGTMIAYLALYNDKTLVYIADAKTGKSRMLTRQPLLATHVASVDWTSDGKSLVGVFVPSNRVAVPPQLLASEPKVRVTDSVKNKFRTYPSVLETSQDARFLEFYSTGQLAVVDARTGAVNPVGAPALIESVNVSPDGRFFRVTTMQRPFSYLVPVSQFGFKNEIWAAAGKVLVELDKQALDLGEQGKPPAPPAARRSITWRPDGNGLSFIETEPRKQAAPADGGAGESDEQSRRGGGGAGAGAPADNRKDRVMQWVTPFGKDDAKIVWTAEGRISGVRYSEDCKTLFVNDSKDGNDRVYAVFLDEPGKTYPISSAKPDEFYDAPGAMLSRTGSKGEPVVTISSDGAVFLYGTKYSKDPRKDAPKAFLDKIVIKTGAKTRLWESSDTASESLSVLLDNDAKTAVLSRQSPTMPPNYYSVDLGAKTEKALTANRDVTPEITGCQRYLVNIVRNDGFKFQAKVTMPANWVRGNKLPAMFWFYPSEFTDQTSYDRALRAYNKNAFPSTSGQSMALLTQLGYAFIEPDLPITGATGIMNNNYVPQLRNSLWAIIDKLDKQGYIDRDRLAISGHSYGAFSTVNALVHTPFFKAGIAGSGAYNRLLTPLGFQSENRELWEARETYLNMSPFLYADQLSGALLMTHGMEDQNIGTNPINSERLFQALNQLGKTAALYMYPYEDHGQIARETVLDKWARWVAWLDKYVKNAK